VQQSLGHVDGVQAYAGRVLQPGMITITQSVSHVRRRATPGGGMAMHDASGGACSRLTAAKRSVIGAPEQHPLARGGPRGGSSTCPQDWSDCLSPMMHFDLNAQRRRCVRTFTDAAPRPHG
jgi:hypothetical protein